MNKQWTKECRYDSDKIIQANLSMTNFTGLTNYIYTEQYKPAKMMSLFFLKTISPPKKPIQIHCMHLKLIELENKTHTAQ